MLYCVRKGLELRRKEPASGGFWPSGLIARSFSCPLYSLFSLFPDHPIPSRRAVGVPSSAGSIKTRPVRVFFYALLREEGTRTEAQRTCQRRVLAERPDSLLFSLPSPFFPLPIPCLLYSFPAGGSSPFILFILSAHIIPDTSFWHKNPSCR